MKLAVAVVLIGFLGLPMTSTVAWAQSNAQVSGTVKDSTGAVMAGVQVTMTQTDTGLARSVVTDGTGFYTMPNLPIGPYKLEAAQSGFSTYLQSGIVLQVADTLNLNVTMTVGQVTQTVQVEEGAALVETRATGISQAIDNTRVVELPLNGRQVTDLIILSGAAVSGGIQTTNRNYPTASISVAGGLNTGVAYLLDGASHNDPFNNLSLPMPFPDALQEFKVETSALQAQNGQHGAGVVTAVMKSGTNEFHGDLFEFLRNGDLNARNTFALTRDSLKRNQFGGVLGGPVLKNKLFFFMGSQVTTQRSAPTTSIAFVPTAAMLAGDWSAITSPACNNGKQVVLKAPFINNQISPSLFSVPSVNLVNMPNFPMSSNPCGQVKFGSVNDSTEAIVDSRLDYALSAKQSLFAHYQLARLDTPTTYDGKDFLSATLPAYTQRASDAVVGDTYLLGSNTVSSFRLTFFRTVNVKVDPPLFTFTQLGVQGFYQYPIPADSLVTVTNDFTIHNSPGGYTNGTGYQVVEDLSLVRGAHQIGFGGNFITDGINILPATVTPGAVTFSATNTGLGLGDFMLGDITTLQQQGLTPYYFRQNYIGLYAQDTWKVNSHLTVTPGLRWDPSWAPYSKDGHVWQFNMADYIAGVHSTVFPNSPAGVLYPGDPGIPNSKSFYENRWEAFAPRLGVAWDPKGDGRMVVRAAYAMFRDYPSLFMYDQIKVTPPWASVVSITNPVGGFANPWAGVPGGSPFPYTVNSSSSWANSQQVVWSPWNLQQPYISQWNLSVQKQMRQNWLVSANYLGNITVHSITSVEGNPAVYLPGSSCVINGQTFTPCSSTSNTIQRRLLSLINPTQGQYFGNIIEASAGGTQRYEALVLSSQLRRSKGVTVLANYTWSHCIGTGVVPSFSGQASYTINQSGVEGNCQLDRRHNINVSVVYDTPKFSSRVLRIAGSNWQVGGILQILSGPYLTAGSGLDTALTAVVNYSATTPIGERPNQVLPNVYTSGTNSNQWLNPAAFAQPATGTYGSMGVQNILGPGLVNINMSLVRKWQIRERHTLEFRAESFNIVNHVNPCAQYNQFTNFSAVTQCPNMNLASSTFGQILNAADPRINQFALKYVF